MREEDRYAVDPMVLCRTNRRYSENHAVFAHSGGKYAVEPGRSYTDVMGNPAKHLNVFANCDLSFFVKMAKLVLEISIIFGHFGQKSECTHRQSTCFMLKNTFLPFFFVEK